MSSMVSPGAKSLKCPNCGAPVAAKSGETVVKCEYCGSRMAVGSQPYQPSPPTTIIIETRYRHVGRHRLRRLLESARPVWEETEDSREDDRGY